MLICKNCDTENNDGTVKCSHCQMGDKLVYLRPDAHKFVAVKVDHNPLSCTNCGCESPGEGNKCRECNFPNAKGQTKNSVNGHAVSQVVSQVDSQPTSRKPNGQTVLESMFNLLDEEDVPKLN